MKIECDHVHAQRPPSRKAVAQALVEAKAACEARGERWTEHRRRAYELLLERGGPVKAYDLLAHLKQGAAKPPTIYRALDALVAMGLVHRIASLTSFIACSGAGHEHAASFVLCDCCGTVEEVQVSKKGMAEALRREIGFEATAITIEAHGLCRHCHL